MNARPIDRPPPREATAELLVLQKWEEFTAWFLERTSKWPKCARFTITQRLENHALDVTELLVEARYQPRERQKNLERVNLRLERMRFLLRIGRGRNLFAERTFEAALRQIDEVGRMLHGWRQAMESGRRERSSRP